MCAISVAVHSSVILISMSRVSQDPWHREYPMLESSLADVYALHISDGLQGIERVLTGIGVFRCSVVPKLSIKQQVSPQEHNRQLVLAAFPKEGFTEVRFPAGTVLWHDDPSIGHAYRAEHDDPTSMTNERLFREGSCETWFVNGRCRFFMRLFWSHDGIEVS